MKLETKKSLAARSLGVAKNRIIFNQERLSEIKEAITKQDIKDLLADNAILIKEQKGARKLKKRKTRRREGSIRKKVKAGKREYIILTRKLRSYLFHLKKTGNLQHDLFREFRKKVKAKQFKSLPQLKESISIRSAERMKILRRRRHEKKTDYKARLALLKSQKPRLVVRKTNKYIIAQIAESDIAQDKTLFRFTSSSLLEKGWPKEHSGSLKGIPASYLTGFFLGKLALEKMKGKILILDIGMHRPVLNSRIFSVLKGAVDAGLKVTHDKEILPSDEFIASNEKFAQIIKKAKGEEE